MIVSLIYIICNTFGLVVVLNCTNIYLVCTFLFSYFRTPTRFRYWRDPLLYRTDVVVALVSLSWTKILRWLACAPTSGCLSSPWESVVLCRRVLLSPTHVPTVAVRALVRPDTLALVQSSPEPSASAYRHLTHGCCSEPPPTT